jgi:hypothetical protein
MVKVNRPGAQKPGSDNTSANAKQQQAQFASPPPTPVTSQPKGKQSGKSRKPTIGGTAVHGAKSTLPKEIPTGTPANQQAEISNRETRRRMQQMGTGPYAERATVNPREARKKRAQEKIRKAVDAKGISRDIRLGRRNTIFVVSLVVAVILLIVLFLIIRHPF